MINIIPKFSKSAGSMENLYYSVVIMKKCFNINFQNSVLDSDKIISFCTYFQWLINILELSEEQITCILSQNPTMAIEYAKGKGMNRFIEAEDNISKSATHSFEYAYAILKNRFEKGEDEIAKDYIYSYYYAKDVLKAPFPKGEKEILNNPLHSAKYASMFYKENTPQNFIDVIKKNPEASLIFAKLTKRMFKEGENAIASNPRTSMKYIKLFIGVPWPKAEPSIAKDANWSYKYSKEILKDRFVLGETSIKKNPNILNKYQELHQVKI